MDKPVFLEWVKETENRWPYVQGVPESLRLIVERHVHRNTSHVIFLLYITRVSWCVSHNMQERVCARHTIIFLVIHDVLLFVFSSLLCSSLCSFPCALLFASHVYLFSHLILFLHVDRQSKHTLRLRHLRSLALWQNSLLPQVMSLTSSRTATFRRLLKWSSRRNPGTKKRSPHDAELDDETFGKALSSLTTVHLGARRTCGPKTSSSLSSKFVSKSIFRTSMSSPSPFMRHNGIFLIMSWDGSFKVFFHVPHFGVRQWAGRSVSQCCLCISATFMPKRRTLSRSSSSLFVPSWFIRKLILLQVTSRCCMAESRQRQPQHNWRSIHGQYFA